MASCELCGKETDLVRTIIESVSFNVCSNCSGHGRAVGELKKQEDKKFVHKREEIVEDVVANFVELIKTKREKLGLTQKELAMKLNIREALISKMENGVKPDLELARKISSFLKIKLVGQERISELASKSSSSQGLTIGDFIKK